MNEKEQLRLLEIEREILLQTLEDKNNEIEDLQSDVAFWKESSEAYEKKCDPQNINEVFFNLDKEKLWTKRLREKNTELELLVANHEGHIKVLQEENNKLKEQLEAYDGVDAELDAYTPVMEAIEEVSEEDMAAIEEEARVIPDKDIYDPYEIERIQAQKKGRVFEKGTKVKFQAFFPDGIATLFGEMASRHKVGESPWFCVMMNSSDFASDSLMKKCAPYAIPAVVGRYEFQYNMIGTVEEVSDAER